MWKSTNAGSTWKLLTDFIGVDAAIVHSDFHALEFSPYNGDLFAGNDGGVYRTSDGGLNWSNNNSGLQITQFYRIGSSLSSDVVFAGSQDNGTSKYENGSWNGILGGDGMECLVDYFDNKTVYVSQPYGIIYRSFDGGNSFLDISPVDIVDQPTLKGSWITPFVFHPTLHTTLFAALKDVYRTDNGTEIGRASCRERV